MERTKDDQPNLDDATPTPIGAPRAEDSTRLRDAPVVPQAPTGRVHLIVGPVGAGKSTFALGLARERSAVRLTLDAWMTTLFAPDRPEAGIVRWYLERAARCIDQIWSIAREIVARGVDVILEIGLLLRDERDRFYERIDDAGIAMTVHVIDAAREVRRERVLRRNAERGHTFSMVVPPAVFEMASDRWEPFDAREIEGRDVRFVQTDPT